MNQKKKVLVVEDEVKIAEVVVAYLQNSGYETVTAYDGLTALHLFEKECPDLIILDLMLPGCTGEEVCKKIRKNSRVPILMLTAKIEEDDKVDGLNMGADDYVTKPFSTRELIARVGSLMRRSDEGIAPLFQKMSWNHSELELDLQAHEVKRDGRTVNLTPNEYKLFCTLVKYPQKTFTREELIEVALGMDYDGFERTIDSHIKNLRSKIESDSANPQYILTVRGVGYKFGEVD
ncbi:MAG: response regulator transcription factor [Lachnospiraceae bacterium]|nr:response regulator transcription factor [Lachnospiraceae bacterium]MDD3659639.1 response regulator transcription factor [Lachnospiraceae bacterium]